MQIDNRMETIVEQILIENPETRKSDDALLFEYIVRTDGAERLYKSYGWVLKHGNAEGYPKRSSVSRARRKVQERRPELKDKETAGYRAELEEEYRDWARNN